jgi:hypothetical protein
MNRYGDAQTNPRVTVEKPSLPCKLAQQPRTCHHLPTVGFDWIRSFSLASTDFQIATTRYTGAMSSDTTPPASADPRRAGRLIVNAPAIVESIGQAPMSLHPNLAAVYRRVQADADTVNRRFPAVVRDLSTNGAFIAGVSLPLLARVALRFDVVGVGKIDAIGWVLWQRSEDCKVPSTSGAMVTLPKGFGVLFESLALEVRNSIAKLLPS